jgi:hypothetical protein
MTFDLKKPCPPSFVNIQTCPIWFSSVLDDKYADYRQAMCTLLEAMDWPTAIPAPASIGRDAQRSMRLTLQFWWRGLELSFVLWRLGSIPALHGEGTVARSDLAELTVLPEMTA